MISGYKTCQFYKAMKLHFTVESFDIFKTKGNIKGSYESYLKRTDYKLFEVLASKLKQDSIAVRYLASNFMYGKNPFDMVYNIDEGMENYTLFSKRREAMTYTFKTDLDTLMNHVESVYDEKSGLLKMQNVIPLLLNNDIAIETLVILNSFDKLSSTIKNQTMSWIVDPYLLKIRKSTGFVKFDKSKVVTHYQSFKEELKNYYEQDLPLSA